MEFWFLFPVVGCLGICFCFWLLYRNPLSWQRPILIGTLMGRHGIGFKRIVELGLEDELEARARVCFACREIGECQVRLRGTGSVRYRDICPNADFMDFLLGEEEQGRQGI